MRFENISKNESRKTTFLGYGWWTDNQQGCFYMIDVFDCFPHGEMLPLPEDMVLRKRPFTNRELQARCKAKQKAKVERLESDNLDLQKLVEHFADEVITLREENAELRTQLIQYQIA